MEFSDAKIFKKQVKKLYRSAFPANERPPFIMLMKKADNKNNFFYAVVDNGDFIGLVYTICTEKIVYVFFLAVIESMRGKGYGADIIDRIKKISPNKTVTLMIEDTNEVHAVNYEDRLKRLEFYKNNGFYQLGIRINEAGVDFELLGTDLNVTQSDFLSFMKKYWGSKLLFNYLYRKMNI